MLTSHVPLRIARPSASYPYPSHSCPHLRFLTMQSKPAIQKLKCLAEMEEFLAQKKYHELFVSAGGLGVLKAWLEPYSDGSLPNTRVRTAVLKVGRRAWVLRFGFR